MTQGISNENNPKKESHASGSRVVFDTRQQDTNDTFKSGGAKQQIRRPKGKVNKQSRNKRNFSGRTNQRHNKHNKGKQRPRQKKIREFTPHEELTGETILANGLLDMSEKGFGFLREKENDYEQSDNDIFIPPVIIRKYMLRPGNFLETGVRMGRRGKQVCEIYKINDLEPDKYKKAPFFEDLTATNPTRRMLLETDKEVHSTRIIDMLCPIGFGQRGLIVAPPRAGKTTLLENLADAVIKNQNDTRLIILLIDERPEEVTEFRRKFPDAEVMASSNDSETRAHIRLAKMAIDRAKRCVEVGEDVFLLLDSITRLARAHNNSVKGKGRSGSGGVDVRALIEPRKFFAAARNTKEAGSLSIIATALVETNSRADEVIFREFKGTGNMEVALDRQIAEKYIYPAINIFKSGTRREELLIPERQMKKIRLLRGGLVGFNPSDAVDRMKALLDKFTTNAMMLLNIKTGA